LKCLLIAHVCRLLPRIFKGFQDDEIDDLNRPMVRSQNAKEMVEHAIGGAGRYCLEEHAVFTPDGYILILHRLRFTKNRQTGDENNYTGTFGSGLYEKRRNAGNAPPVLLNHGSMMTSEVWLAAPSHSVPGDEGIPTTLPHVLLHAGYDVWLANRRGNKYSCKHTHLHTASKEFWSFSLDEPACRDFPAVIDYICAETEFSSLSIVGFSQGSAETLAALSMVKTLNRKVNLAIMLAPTTRPKGK
jgi:lysosomal acid lipase/cholesteryl ester hydrolase